MNRPRIGLALLATISIGAGVFCPLDGLKLLFFVTGALALYIYACTLNGP